MIPQKTAQGTTLGLFPNQSSPVGFKKIFEGMNGPDLGLLFKNRGRGRNNTRMGGREMLEWGIEERQGGVDEKKE